MPDNDPADWIGREEEAEDQLTPALVQRFAATFGMEDCPDAIGMTAPPLIHFCLFPPVTPTSALRGDGHPPLGGFLPPIPLERRMWAAGSLIFHRAMGIGDTVHRRSRIAEVQAKHGSSGSLYFVTVNHRIMTGDALAVEEEQTIVYRDKPSQVPLAAQPARPALPGQVAEVVAPSTALLFRYSALTFNSHRIHYDRDYARDVEGYPDLVVHGPLQATLLMNLAVRSMQGRRPDRFEFRSTGPLFVNDTIELHHDTWGGDTLNLWTARAGGSIAMQAKAIWA